jgi:serine kinase
MTDKEKESAEKERTDFLKKRGYGPFEALDSGGQANVYKTTKNKVIFAAKVIHVENPNNTKLEDDLKRELEIVTNLKHPNCIRVEDLFRTKTKVYIIMDYMPNGNVGSVIRKSGPLCEWKTKAWFCPIAKAVQYLHKHKIAHRDLKLDNILLDAHFNPKLTDFGFSRFVATDPKSKKGEKSDTFCGTPSYNAPEIISHTPYDPYIIDVWCLGICLFVMLNEDYPFDRANKEKMYENQMKRNFKFRSAVESKVSADVKDLIRKLLEPDPNTRININDVCKHFWFPVILQEI